MQTLMDDHRSMSVNQELYTRLMQLKSATNPVITPSALKTASLSPHLLTLPSAGMPPVGSKDAIDRGFDGRRLHADDLAGAESPPLAFGGADVVILARHDGLPCMCNRSVGYVVFPAQNGAMYATILTSVDFVSADV